MFRAQEIKKTRENACPAPNANINRSCLLCLFPAFTISTIQRVRRAPPDARRDLTHIVTKTFYTQYFRLTTAQIRIQKDFIFCFHSVL